MRQLATAGLGLAQESSDWSQVIDLGRSFLQDKSKDLRVACYLAVAWVHREQRSGALAGLELITELLRAYPDTLHPRAKRGRVIGRDRAVAWYAEQLQAWLAQNKGSAVSKEEQARWRSLCAALGEVSPEVLAQAGPISTSLAKQLTFAPASSGSSAQVPNDTQNVSARAEKKASSSPETQASLTRPQNQATTSHAAPQTPESPLDLAQICQMQRRLAAQLRIQNRLDPLSFRLMRQAMWTPMLDLDPSKLKNIQLPTQIQRRDLHAHLEHERWPGLLELTEELFAMYPLCLDLQRFSAMAAGNLQNGANAKKEILSELGTLLRRMPDLVHINGTKGLPLADAATRSWIGETFQGHTPARPTPISPTRSPSWWTAIEGARDQDHSKLLQAIQEALDLAPDRRSYAQRALQVASKDLPVPGLALLVLHLAIDALALHKDAMLDRDLEGACIQALLQRRHCPQGQSPAVYRCPDTKALALALGRRSLVAALPYFRCASQSSK